MAKLFIQELPSLEDFDKNHVKAEVGQKIEYVYSSLLFAKIGNEIENSHDALLAPYGLSFGRFLMLSFLLRKENEAGLKPTEMAQHLGVTQATMSGLISNLEKSGYIEKEINGQDARSYSIKASTRGQEVYKEIVPIWADKVSEWFGTITPEEYSQLMELIRKLLASKFR